MLRLPRNADTDKVKAEYRNGILHITVPKRELKQEDEAQAEEQEEQGKKVEIA